MKAEELMIGDWVQLHYTDYLTREKVVKNVKIDQIRKYERTVDSYHAWSRESGNIGDVENLFPIPLTPEILEKNGWRIDGVGNGLFYYHDEVPFYIAWGSGWSVQEDLIFFDDWYEYVMMKLTFVHQLQHALRLCGIDKQIEL